MGMMGGCLLRGNVLASLLCLPGCCLWVGIHQQGRGAEPPNILEWTKTQHFVPIAAEDASEAGSISIYFTYTEKGGVQPVLKLHLL